jgi:uncharacterized repeat protein (TIGR03847 family)
LRYSPVVTRRFYIFDDPDRFVAGTVGKPGQRTFFLQAVQGTRIASVVLEKVQVAVLADRIAAILAELQRRGVAAETLAAVGDDERPLDEPLREEFRVATLTISWDSDEAEVLLEARSGVIEEEDDTDEVEDEEEGDADEGEGDPLEVEEVDEVEDADEDDEIPDDAPEGPDVLRVRLSPAMALGFAQRAARVLAGGRPACPFCGQPLNPEGHICPRKNGYLN